MSSTTRSTCLGMLLAMRDAEMHRRRPADAVVFTRTTSMLTQSRILQGPIWLVRKKLGGATDGVHRHRWGVEREAARGRKVAD